MEARQAAIAIFARVCHDYLCGKHLKDNPRAMLKDLSWKVSREEERG